MRGRTFSGTSAALAVFVGAACASAQIVDPSKVVPPPAQKTTVSGTLTTVTPAQTQRQQYQQNKPEVPSPPAPAQMTYASPEVTSLSLSRLAAPKELPLLDDFTPWISTPSVNWFALTAKDLPKSWDPPPVVKGASFDQPARNTASSWEQKPKASFDTTPPASPTHSWDDNPDPRPKGSKVDWKWRGGFGSVTLGPMDPQSYYRCWVEVDLNALRHNVAAIRRRIGSAKLIAVVKADAYGHGLAQVASTLMQSGVDAFAVANLAEALVVRHVGGGGWPILLFGSALPFEVAKIVEQSITPTISTLDEAQLFETEAALQNKTIPVQVEIDMGMGRVGFWHKEAAEQIAKLATLPHLRIEALYTHFPSADENVAESKRGLDAFLSVARRLNLGVPLHAANSAALLNLPESILDAVRPGLLLYGIAPGSTGRDGPPGRPSNATVGARGGRALPTTDASDEFRPVLTFKARVALVKNVATGRSISYGQTFFAQAPMKIATIAAGYSDGFIRNLSNAAQVLINGQRCPVVGRVTMDQIMVDVTALADVECGDEVVFIGRQRGAEITASEMANWAGTIAWEVLCGITKTARVPRVYRGASAA